MNDYGRMTSGLAREYMNYVYSCSADRKEARSKIDRLLNIADVFGFSFDQLAENVGAIANLYAKICNFLTMQDVDYRQKRRRVLLEAQSHRIEKGKIFRDNDLNVFCKDIFNENTSEYFGSREYFDERAYFNFTELRDLQKFMNRQGFFNVSIPYAELLTRSQINEKFVAMRADKEKYPYNYIVKEYRYPRKIILRDMCRSIHIFRWNNLPGKHVCKECGKEYVGDEGLYIQRNVYYAGLWQDVSKGVYIETDGYYGFFNLYKKLFDSGFDVKLVYRCEKCAVKERKPFVEFWFKAVGDEKYTVTYPYDDYITHRFNHEEEKKFNAVISNIYKLKAKCIANDYYAARDFLCGIKPVFGSMDELMESNKDKAITKILGIEN